MKSISTVNAPAPKGHYSQAIESDGLIFVTGQNGTDPKTGKLVEGVAEQADQALQNVERILEEAGSSLNKVVRVGLYLTEISDLATVNEVCAQRFGDVRPARSTLQVLGLPAGAGVALDVVATVQVS